MSSKHNQRFIIIFPESQQHLGLFDDLKPAENVDLIVAGRKKVRNIWLKNLQKLHVSGTLNRCVRLPGKKLWYEPIHLDLDEHERCCIVVFDAALKALDIKYMNSIFKGKNVRAVLVLINAMDASSVGMWEVKKDILKYAWDDIYTFDSKDADKYGFQRLKYCYYSMHDADLVRRLYRVDATAAAIDACFTGGLKGGREAFILAVFTKLHQEGVTVNFNLMVSGVRRLKRNLYQESICYYTGGWMPYEEVLACVLKSNVIIEILQEGQSGPSLRYFEAVCYNKKLLTNNEDIVNFPYYNDGYMKIMKSPDDIDIDWVRRREAVDYRYRGDFSPLNLLQVVLNQDF